MPIRPREVTRAADAQGRRVVGSSKDEAMQAKDRQYTVRPAAALLVAVAGVAMGGCASPLFSPRSGASADGARDGTGRPSVAHANAAPGGKTSKIAPTPKFGNQPAGNAVRRSNELVGTLAEGEGGGMYIRLLDSGKMPGVNSFGEFGSEGERPYRPVAGRAGYQQHSFVDEGFDTDVAVTPDSGWMAFASTRHSTRSDIYLQRTNGLAVTKLTTDPADDAFPAFSPAGDKIAFCSNRAGNWDVYVMDKDGRNVTAITQGPGHDLHPSFSPDGQRLVFCRIGGRSQQWELWVANLSTGEKTMVGFGLFPDWSPRTDIDQIAFQRARQRGGRWFSLWTMQLSPGGEPTYVTEVAMSTNAALVAPAWSPDGERLAFATVVDPDAGMPDTDEAIGRQDIWTVNADGTDRHRITDGKGSYATPAWATDGRVYFVSDRGGTECVWSARAEGQNFSVAATPAKKGAVLSDVQPDVQPDVIDIGTAPAIANTDNAPIPGTGH